MNEQDKKELEELLKDPPAPEKKGAGEIFQQVILKITQLRNQLTEGEDLFLHMAREFQANCPHKEAQIGQKCPVCKKVL